MLLERTRLNVRPAKIMQQTACIAALQTTACAENNDSTRLTAEYLSACNKIFESGFLSKYCVSNQNQTVLDIIQDGMNFFNEWANDVLETFPNVKLTGPLQKVFLAWQIWELMRITHFGFKHLCADFLSVHPSL